MQTLRWRGVARLAFLSMLPARSDNKPWLSFPSDLKMYERGIRRMRGSIAVSGARSRDRISSFKSREGDGVRIAPTPMAGKTGWWRCRSSATSLHSLSSFKGYRLGDKRRRQPAKALGAERLDIPDADKSKCL